MITIATLLHVPSNLTLLRIDSYVSETDLISCREIVAEITNVSTLTNIFTNV